VRHRIITITPRPSRSPIRGPRPARPVPRRPPAGQRRGSRLGRL